PAGTEHGGAVGAGPPAERPRLLHAARPRRRDEEPAPGRPRGRPPRPGAVGGPRRGRGDGSRPSVAGPPLSRRGERAQGGVAPAEIDRMPRRDLCPGRAGPQPGAARPAPALAPMLTPSAIS